MGALRSNLGLKFLAALIAVFLWWVAHGSTSIERGYDLPIVVQGVPEDMVITAQSADVVNVRVLGSRAALRNLNPERIEYDLDASGAKPGVADFEVDTSHLDLPRGARIVSRSPAQLAVTFEQRGSKSVPVRPELEGSPAPGFAVEKVEVIPPRVRIFGARSEVLRLAEAVTETIDVSGLTATEERDVRVSPGSGHLWVEDPGSVRVRIRVAPLPPSEAGPVKEG
jgi:YbbR domain-containing protein